jgi:hypothetical protein
MPVTEIKSKRYECDGCHRVFLSDPKAKMPGIQLQGILTFGSHSIAIEAWAHTKRCVGPAFANALARHESGKMPLPLPES